MSDKSGVKIKSLGQLSPQPHHSMSLSTVCPGKLSWDIGLKSYLKE